MLKFKLNNTTIALLVVVLVVVLIYLYGMPKMEKLTNEEQQMVDTINKTTVLPQFKDMDPIKLYAVFNNNMDFITDIMVKNNIPPSLLQDPAKYPQISTYLFNQGVLKTEPKK